MAEHPFCERCKFWDPSTQLDNAQIDTTGQCRANSPRIDKRSGRALWPFTENTDWCGAFTITPGAEPDHA